MSANRPLPSTSLPTPHHLHPPTHAPHSDQAKEELAKLGPMSTDEKITAFAFAITVGLWIFGGAVGVNAVAAALTGLAILLVTGGLE